MSRPRRHHVPPPSPGSEGPPAMALRRSVRLRSLSPAPPLLLLLLQLLCILFANRSGFVQCLLLPSPSRAAATPTRRRFRCSGTVGRASEQPGRCRVSAARFEGREAREPLAADEDRDGGGGGGGASSTSSTSSSYLATCIPGLSKALASELVGLGCRRVEATSPSGVAFRATLPQAIRALAWTRTAHKVLEFLCSSDTVRDRDSLMNFVRGSVDVKDLLGDGRGGLLTLSVQVVMTGKQRMGGEGEFGAGKAPSDLTHSKFTALSIKNALCDEVRDLRGDRPDVDPDDPDVPLVAFVRRRSGAGDGSSSSVSLYRQLHVGSLHRRGYRSPDDAVHRAAMKESLAAGLLASAGWGDRIMWIKEEQTQPSRAKGEGTQPPQQPLVLVDPMAGSGTLVVEAVLMAADVAPGLMRAARSTLSPRAFPGQRVPPVARWKRPQNDDTSNSAAALQIWNDELAEASRRAKAGIEWLRSSRSVRFLANDRHPGAVDLIERSLREANRVLPGLDSLVEVHQGDCADWRPLGGANSGGAESDSQRWVVVTNPPWGERLSEDMHGAWESLRAFLRGGACPPGGAEAWVLSGNPAATRHLGLQRSASVPIKTGQQDLRWLRYEIRDKSSPPSPGSFQAPQPREGMGVARQQVNRADSLKRERFQRASFASSRKAPAATRSKQDRPNRNRSAASTRANPPPAKRSPSENEWLT